MTSFLDEATKQLDAAASIHKSELTGFLIATNRAIIAHLQEAQAEDKVLEPMGREFVHALFLGPENTSALCSSNSLILTVAEGGITCPKCWREKYRMIREQLDVERARTDAMASVGVALSLAPSDWRDQQDDLSRTHWMDGVRELAKKIDDALRKT